ncbi:MAG: RNA methyltransferase, partial [Polaromonas sp.]|nr:RNA methyltransferase [Polaromonas sp.]
MKTRFVLINTSHAGNVGATARAMKVMGFGDLVLVAPRWANVLRREETIQRASGALDVLANARIVATLDEALDGMTHLCATAMTPRDFGPPTRAPREHFAALLANPGLLLKSELSAQGGYGLEADLASKHEGVAFLFGSERFGMQNEDVYRCHVALSIPTDPGFGSLNLAAAVQLIAYDWRQALGGFAVQPATPEPQLADAAAVAGMLGHWERALADIGFLDPASPKKLMPRLNQLFNRAGL